VERTSGQVTIPGDNPDEIFDLVDLQDQVIGRVKRKQAHQDPTLVHRSIQVMVFDSSGKRVLLQRRSRVKDLFPGYFCASASGHVASGENYAETAVRETEEELGCVLTLAYVGKEVVRSVYETEMTALFLGCSDGPFSFHPIETDGGEFLALADVERYQAEESLDMTPALQAALRAIFRLRGDGLLDALLAELRPDGGQEKL
jgi:16S rRNA (adenine1518-N6/adenine1519-N6)-dimethyltransferase